MDSVELSLCSSGVADAKLRLLAAYLTPGATLDVGCGNGLYGLYIAGRGSPVMQVDIQDRRDARARHLPFRAMNAQRLDVGDKAYVNVLAFDIMEHLDDDAAFLTEVRRVCRGRLLLSVPNADDEQPRRIGLTHVHHTDKTHRREYTRDGLTGLLTRTGFRVVEVRPNVNPALPYFAHALAKPGLMAKIAAGIVSVQCRALERAGLFENRCIGDWYCAADVT